jgi:hypothetical protein
MAGNESYTIVMPIKLSADFPELDLRRLFRVAARSIQRFFEPQMLSIFMVVADTADLKVIEERSRTEMPGFPFAFVDEKTLCPTLAKPDDRKDGIGWQGWHRQQVLKIAAASIVDTQCYVTMDDDVVLTKPVTPASFRNGGRLILEHFALRDYPKYRPWYDACCNVLHVPTSLISDTERVMGFTPQIMVTSLMAALQNEVQTLWPRTSYDESLLQLAGVAVPLTSSRFANRVIQRVTGRRAVRNDVESEKISACRHWTEHQLYWTYLKKLGISDQYYSVDGPQLSAFGFWKENALNSEIDAYVEREFTQDHDHLFSVIGSRVKGLDREYLYDKIASRLSS